MKRTLFLSLLAIFFSVSFLCSVGCNQKPTKEQSSKEQSSVSEKKLKEEYELQERCGKSSEEYFRRNFSSRNSLYRNHYNKKLNKCFMLIHSLGDGYENRRLFDIHENNLYGQIDKQRTDITGCYVLDKQCKALEEWDLLIKSYMEE